MSYNNQSISIRLHIKTGDSLWSAVWCLFQRVGGNIGHQLPETTFRRLGCLVLALLSLQLSGKNPFLIRSQKSHQPSISFHFLDNSSLGCQENVFTSPSFCDLPPQVTFLHGLLEDFLMCTTVCRSSRMGFMHSLASSKPLPQLILIKESKIATPSDFYVDDNKNMNLSCWGIKIRHPLWLLYYVDRDHNINLSS